MFCSKPVPTQKTGSLDLFAQLLQTKRLTAKLFSAKLANFEVLTHNVDKESNQ